MKWLLARDKNLLFSVSYTTREPRGSEISGQDYHFTTRAGFEKPPFPGTIGARVVQELCQVCWQEWQRQQTMLINHYGLNPAEPETRKMLRKEMEAFFFGEESLAAGDLTPDSVKN